ncbi:MAG: DUF2007 domain-containing protein [Rikenellaceae bacterium]
MKIDKMVVLAEYGSALEAEMAKSILDSTGIWSMINNEYMSTIYATGVVPAQLIVMETDRQRAADLLARETKPAEEELEPADV